MAKTKQKLLIDESGPTPERTRQGLIERLDHAIADEAGRPARPYRGVDSLTLMLRRGTISPGMHQAAEDFRALFHRASLDPLRAPDLARVPSGHRTGDVPLSLRQADARAKIWATLQVLGGIASPAGSCVWHVVGCESSVRIGRCAKVGVDDLYRKKLLRESWSVRWARCRHTSSLNKEIRRNCGSGHPILAIIIP
jgi:hypothetical protein